MESIIKYDAVSKQIDMFRCYNVVSDYLLYYMHEYVASNSFTGREYGV